MLLKSSAITLTGRFSWPVIHWVELLPMRWPSNLSAKEKTCDCSRCWTHLQTMDHATQELLRKRCGKSWIHLNVLATRFTCLQKIHRTPSYTNGKTSGAWLSSGIGA